MFVIIALFAPLSLSSQGFYSRPPLAPRHETVWQLVKGCALLFIGTILALFFIKRQLPRVLLVLFGAIGFTILLAKEEFLRQTRRSTAARDQLRRRIIIAGEAGAVAEISAQVNASTDGDLDIVREFDLDAHSLAELVACCHEKSVNTVVFCGHLRRLSLLEPAVQACEQEGIEALLLADFLDLKVSRISFDHFLDRPALVYSTTPNAEWQLAAKRILDVAGAALLLMLTSPAFVLIPIAIWISMPGPIFFRQKRAGLNGRPFTFFKFRSMVVDAEHRKIELHNVNELNGPVFKVSNDPRVTALGKILRRSSLDELPQLFNVLRGEMSLVGPRPLPLDEVKRFADLSFRRRLSVRPGLTGLWQVSGRCQITNFSEWVRLDLQYIDRWSLMLDFTILLRTLPAVISARGAK
jgi:exopolysaccharide biosynthesis polyprenyl glycosylphosphotransferase